MEKFRLDNKISLITGGSRGIGFGIAKSLAEAGSDVVMIARNSTTLEKAKKKLTGIGRRIWTYPFDMSNIEKIDELFKSISKDTGGVDIIVNNAGVNRTGSAETLTLEDWYFVINLNMTAAFVLSKAFANERIKSRKGGKIINITSISTETVHKDNALYGASKGGIRQLTKALSVDWAQYKINVNAIGPGFIFTDLTKPFKEDENFDKWVKWKTPWGKWGNPEDIGNAAVYLASPASDYVTGHTLYIDGGLLCTWGPTSW